MDFVESHCHLDDDAFASDLPEVIDAARRAGVRHFINIGYEPESWTSSLDLANRFPDVSFTLGMHPNSADRWNGETAGELERLLSTSSPVAIGEIGFDYFRDHVDPGQQRSAFSDQLDLARQFSLPVVIHMRGDVEDQVVDVLNRYPDVRIIFHSFDASSRLRDFALNRQALIGVGGLMTRTASTDLRGVLERVPLESILLETDSPYLVPKGMKARRNEPVNLPIIASKLGDLLGVSVDKVAEKTTANAIEVFALEKVGAV